MSEKSDAVIDRLTFGDLLAGARMLLLPVAVALGLVEVSRLFRDTVAPVDAGTIGGVVPHEAWLIVLIGYLAACLPRHSFSLRIPGLASRIKIMICIVAAAGFLLELNFHDVLAPYVGAGVALVLAIACIILVGTIIRAERLRLDSANEAKDLALERMILDLEKLNNRSQSDPAITHPALFAQVSSIVQPQSPIGTSIWFLRPHPALGYKRPIDVLQEHDGENKLLHACRIGPNR